MEYIDTKIKEYEQELNQQDAIEKQEETKIRSESNLKQVENRRLA